MSSLQKLIVKFNNKKNIQLFTAIIREIQSAEKLWIAYSEASRNYYLGNEEGKAAAYIFSEEEYFEPFCEHERVKGYETKVMENTAEYRMALFADLYRSGFEVIVIDNGQTYLRLSLFDIIKKPVPQTENKDTRLIVNPSLVRTADWFFQEDAKSPANIDMWKLLFSEVFNAEYIVPADTSKLKVKNVKSGEIKLKRRSEVSFPILENSEGKRYYPFFTDWNELRKYDAESKFSALSASFEDLENFSGKADGIVINPYGSNIILTAEMLESIKKTTADVKKMKSQILVGDPKEVPEEMLSAMTEVMKGIPEIKAAYIRLMLKDEAQSYLVKVEYEGTDNPAPHFDAVTAAAMPHSGGLPIDFVLNDSGFSRKAFDKTEPFYKR